MSGLFILTKSTDRVFKVERTIKGFTFMPLGLTRVFVYGTLMRGHRNQRFMDGAAFIGPAVTAEAFYEMRLLPSRSSPGRFTPVVTGEGFSRIAGEVYELGAETLRRVDELEGGRYARRTVNTSQGLADMYIYCAAGDSFVDPVDKEYRQHICFQDAGRIYSWAPEQP